jgi:hypothetical protein
MSDDTFQDPVSGSAIFAALVNASLHFPTITKDAEGYGYNYTDLASVRKSTLAVMADNGLCIVQFPVGTGDASTVGVKTILGHTSGEQLSETCYTKVSVHKGMSSEQCTGTAITYLRRYAWLAVLGLATEDNDAAAPAKPQSRGGQQGGENKGGW